MLDRNHRTIRISWMGTRNVGHLYPKSIITPGQCGRNKTAEEKKRKSVHAKRKIVVPSKPQKFFIFTVGQEYIIHIGNFKAFKI